MSTDGHGGSNIRRREPAQSTGSEPDFATPRAELAAEAAFQWGMFTAAQAVRLGLTRRNLSGMVARGHVEHTDSRGVYRFAGVHVDAVLDGTRSNWLALSPELFVRERLKALRDSNSWNDAIVSHLTAANWVYELGNRQPDSIDFTVPTRRRVRDPATAFYPRAEKPRWESVDGLPVTTVAQTIADLYADHLDQGHLGEILYAALLHRGENLHDIAEALDPVTDGHGRDTALRLLEIANAPAEIVTANDMLYNLGR